MLDYLTDISRAFRVADLFDIAIMVVLFYIILLWFKMTASRFVFIGISILGLIYVLARFFQLYVTVFVLQGFFAIVVIAMVVIFQEDLRRIFERMAMWRLIRKRRPSASTYQEIDILCRAVNKLALRRFGALIVLKGHDHLDRHLEGGFSLQGKLSEPLVESIFDPHSVGHDGAIIIEDGQVAQFGCHLPLSLNTLKIGNLGLRHTAALGLVERSDALCIVVSEERGTIGIAQGGELEKLESLQDLRQHLEDFYQKRFPGGTEGSWLRWLRENSREKGLAILLACGLWLALGYQTESVRRDFIVPIEYRNLASHWILEEPKAKEATVTLTGSEQAFNLLNTKSLKISLDMSQVLEGKQEFVLERDHVKYPPNLSVFRVEPTKIEITAHKMISINIPIKVRTIGELSPEITLKQIVVNPESVKAMVMPPNTKDVKIHTEPIELSNIKSPVTLSPKLVFPSDIQFLNNKQPEVKVTFDVKQKETTEKEIQTVDKEKEKAR
ncbi:MAG: diadenylate cyclase [Thermodesulfobacteriota bacterium]|nr:diadenylate cyclase [Thermodesulfobacteriota bacterium]